MMNVMINIKNASAAAYPIWSFLNPTLYSHVARVSVATPGPPFVVTKTSSYTLTEPVTVMIVFIRIVSLTAGTVM